MEVLFGGRAFKESELQLAETAMSNAGLREYVRDGLRIKVPKSKRDIYIKALAAGNAIPPEMGNALDTAVSGGQCPRVAVDDQDSHPRRQATKDRHCTRSVSPLSIKLL